MSVTHDPDSDPESMLREADVAMYRAKGAGGRRLELFDEKLRREVSAHLEIEGRLRHALPRDELLLAYQPIMPLAGGHAIGGEALVRWNPRGADVSKTGQLLPSTFLPRAAESELIVEIGDWVLHTACAQAAALASRRHADPDLRQYRRARADRAGSRSSGFKRSSGARGCPRARCAWR